MEKNQNKDFDIVLFGATGFTGRLVAEYLAKMPVDAGFSWAIAGRDRAKLDELQRHLSCNESSHLPSATIEADVGDQVSLAAMAGRARVLISTVGPYIRYGEGVVEACIEASCDYVDLTGEPEFVDGLIQRHGDAAKAKQVRIVNCCGFDSIPYDLGVLYAVNALHQQTVDDQGALPEALDVEGFVRAAGRFSGGTWQSAITAFGRARDFYKLSAERKRSKRQHRSSEFVVSSLKPSLKYRKHLAAWACPFPTIDPQVVKRSARIRQDYAKQFRYGHYVLVRKLPKLIAGAGTIGGLFALSQIRLTRGWLLQRLPSGEGPSEVQRANGWFRVIIEAKARDHEAVVEVRGGDPGYYETSRMLAESALALCLDRDRLPPHTGVVTPSAGIGEVLIERLKAIGIVFEVTSLR